MPALIQIPKSSPHPPAVWLRGALTNPPLFLRSVLMQPPLFFQTPPLFLRSVPMQPHGQ